MDTRAILVFLLVGLVAGFLGSLIAGGGGGLIAYLIAGVLGSFVGGFIFSSLKIDLKISNPFVAQVITSTVGAIVVIIVARLIT